MLPKIQAATASQAPPQNMASRVLPLPCALAHTNARTMYDVPTRTQEVELVYKHLTHFLKSSLMVPFQTCPIDSSGRDRNATAYGDRRTSRVSQASHRANGDSAVYSRQQASCHHNNPNKLRQNALTSPTRDTSLTNILTQTPSFRRMEWFR